MNRFSKRNWHFLDFWDAKAKGCQYHIFIWVFKNKAKSKKVVSKRWCKESRAVGYAMGPETCNSWTSYLIIEEISTISNTLGAPCMSVDTDHQSSVIIT